MLYGMSENIKRMETSVSDINRDRIRYAVMVDHVSQSLKFVFLSYWLDSSIAVSFGQQIKKGNNMNLIIPVGSFPIGSEIGILIIGISGKSEGRTITCKQMIFSLIQREGIVVIKLP